MVPVDLEKEAENSERESHISAPGIATIQSIRGNSGRGTMNKWWLSQKKGG